MDEQKFSRNKIKLFFIVVQYNTYTDKIDFTGFFSGHYIYLIIPFWYASAAYQSSLVEPWFVFWNTHGKTKQAWYAAEA